MSDTETAMQLLEGDLDAALSDAKAEVKKQRTMVVRFAFDGDAMAADTIAETLIQALAWGGSLYAAYVVFDDAITADNTDFGSILVYKYDAAGGNQTLIASATTELVGAGGMGDVTAFVRKAMTLVDAAVAVVQGGCITFETTKDGMGVALPNAVVELHLKQT